jgi:hypothetical protein
MTIVVPLADQQKIRSVILNDEGGFIFDRDSSQETDPDGGWTWAGVTRKVWEDYVGHPMPFATIAHMQEYEYAATEALATEIYYANYAKPLSALFHIRPYYVYELSCAVNCGYGIAKDLIIRNPYDSTTSSYEKEFLNNWMYHYIKLVTDNAIAWRHYAMSGRPSDKPKTFRASNLKGWFNRVERYR